jgi:DNA-binding transcriptional MerR regulator
MEEPSAEGDPAVAPAMDADMRTGEEVPIYRIRTVSALTGVPARRLRNWETEYALLRPARTKGGHRLYSIRDVKRIRDIRRLTEEEGMSLQAVSSWLDAQPEDHVLVGPQNSGSRVGKGP